MKEKKNKILLLIRRRTHVECNFDQDEIANEFFHRWEISFYWKFGYVNIQLYFLFFWMNFGNAYLIFKLTTLGELRHGYLVNAGMIPCCGHKTIVCKQVNKDGLGFYFCVDENIEMKLHDKFFVLPGKRSNKNEDLCFVLDKSLFVKL